MQHPITIESHHVRATLRHLLYDREPGETPLAYLALIQRRLLAAGFQPSPTARRLELGHLLTEIVTGELAALRRRHGLAPSASAADPCAALRADFGLGQRELEAWSAIYHVYLRPDLDIGLQTLERLLPQHHRRTLQRRLQRGVVALTARLRALEHEAVQSEEAGRRRARGPAHGWPPARPRGAALSRMARIARR